MFDEESEDFKKTAKIIHQNVSLPNMNTLQRLMEETKNMKNNDLPKEGKIIQVEKFTPKIRQTRFQAIKWDEEGRELEYKKIEEEEEPIETVMETRTIESKSKPLELNPLNPEDEIPCEDNCGTLTFAQNSKNLNFLDIVNPQKLNTGSLQGQNGIVNGIGNVILEPANGTKYDWKKVHEVIPGQISLPKVQFQKLSQEELLRSIEMQKQQKHQALLERQMHASEEAKKRIAERTQERMEKMKKLEETQMRAVEHFQQMHKNDMEVDTTPTSSSSSAAYPSNPAAAASAPLKPRKTLQDLLGKPKNVPLTIPSRVPLETTCSLKQQSSSSPASEVLKQDEKKVSVLLTKLKRNQFSSIPTPENNQQQNSEPIPTTPIKPCGICTNDGMEIQENVCNDIHEIEQKLAESKIEDCPHEDVSMIHNNEMNITETTENTENTSTTEVAELLPEPIIETTETTETIETTETTETAETTETTETTEPVQPETTTQSRDIVQPTKEIPITLRSAAEQSSDLPKEAFQRKDPQPNEEDVPELEYSMEENYPSRKGKRRYMDEPATKKSKKQKQKSKTPEKLTPSSVINIQEKVEYPSENESKSKTPQDQNTAETVDDVSPLPHNIAKESINQLRILCKQRNLEVFGTKKDIIQRLKDYENKNQ